MIPGCWSSPVPLLGALSGSTSSSTVAQVSLFLVMGSVGIFRRLSVPIPSATTALSTEEWACSDV